MLASRNVGVMLRAWGEEDTFVLCVVLRREHGPILDTDGEQREMARMTTEFLTLTRG